MLAACGGDDASPNGPPLCTPGVSQACACVVGEGVQVCNAAGTFDECSCVPPIGMPDGSTSEDAARDLDIGTSDASTEPDARASDVGPLSCVRGGCGVHEVCAPTGECESSDVWATTRIEFDDGAVLDGSTCESCQACALRAPGRDDDWIIRVSIAHDGGWGWEMRLYWTFIPPGINWVPSSPHFFAAVVRDDESRVPEIDRGGFRMVTAMGEITVLDARPGGRVEGHAEVVLGGATPSERPRMTVTFAADLAECD